MSSTLTARRIDEVDLLRGTAAVLMVLGHSFIQYPVDISSEPVCAALGHFIYTFHMELFFVLAGFVYRCRSYKPFIIKKVKRLLVPYFLFGSIFALLHAYGGAAINGLEPLSVGIPKLFLTGGGLLVPVCVVYDLSDFSAFGKALPRHSGPALHRFALHPCEQVL